MYVYITTYIHTYVAYTGVNLLGDDWSDGLSMYPDRYIIVGNL